MSSPCLQYLMDIVKAACSEIFFGKLLFFKLTDLVTFQTKYATSKVKKKKTPQQRYR